MKQDNSAVQLFRKVIYGCIIVVLVYGMFQIVVLGGRVNPYTIYMNTFIGNDKDFEAYYASSEYRLFGRISSVFLHPMNFAMFLGVTIIYLYHLTQHRKKMTDVLLLISAMIIALLCGVRSVLAALAVSFTFILLVSRKFKFVISIAGGVIVLYIIMSLSPDLQKYLGSIVNSDNSSVSGSSIEMRLNQLEGAIDEMMANPIFGLGNQWTKYYISLHGDHPICLAFESLVFVVLCNFGIIGIVNYSFMIKNSFTVNSKLMIVKNIDNDTRHILNTLLVFYLAYSIITGDYGYLKYTLIFYVLTYSITKSELKATYNKYKYEHKDYCTLPTAIPSHT